MNEWIAEELAGLQKRKQVQATIDNRQDVLEKQAEVLWNALNSVLKDALEKLNSTTEFRELAGKLRLTVSNPNTIVIRKTGAFPKTELRIGRAAHYVTWKHLGTGGYTAEGSLRIDLDEHGQPFFVREETLTTDETVRDMLRPFLYP